MSWFTRLTHRDPIVPAAPPEPPSTADRMTAAAQAGDFVRLRELVGSGETFDGMLLATALLALLRRGEVSRDEAETVDIARQLIAIGAKIDVWDREHHRTILFWAMLANSRELVRLIVEAGADPTHGRKCGFSVGAKGDTKPLYESPLDACLAEPPEAAPEIVALIRHARPRNAGAHTLECAARLGATELVEWLIRSGIDVNSTTAQGSPLRTAVEYGQREVAALLIAAGADLDHLDESGHTPLDQAQSLRAVEMIELLRSAGARRGPESELESAIAARDPERVREVLSRARLAPDVLGRALLTSVSARGETHLGLVRDLVEAGAEIDYREVETGGDDWDRLGKPYGPTPLGKAVESGNVDLVRLLVAAGADPTIGDMGGAISPLCYACARGQDDAAMRAIADEVRKARPRTFSGTTLLEAVQSGAIELARHAIQAGISPNWKTDLGTSMLVVAVQDGRPEMVDLLVEHRVDLQGWGPDGAATARRRAVERQQELERIYAPRPPEPVAPVVVPHRPAQVAPPPPEPVPPSPAERLIAAAGTQGWLAVRDLLAANRFDPATLSAALRRVAWRDGFRQVCDIARALLEAGADVNSIDPSDGRSALVFAVNADNLELAQLLLEAGADPTIRDAANRSTADHCRQSEGPNSPAILRLVEAAVSATAPSGTTPPNPL